METYQKKAKKLLIISSDKNLREVLNFCFDGWGFEVTTCEALPNGIAPIKKMFPDVVVVDVHSASQAHLEVCRLLKDDFVTAFIPVIALINKRQLRSQLLNIKQGVDDYLIKPPDPLDLRVRVEMAIKRAQYSFHATPLTGLPGGRNIEEVLKERLRHPTPFTFGYLDIDNFKFFNDGYGYLKGDRAIMQTAYILYTAIKKLGHRDDFIGHIGGDDFVFITTPEKYRDICDAFITDFNRIMPFHYVDADRHRGFITARGRDHKIRNIPLMSVSVAIVHKNSASEFKNIIEINEKVAEIKRYLKSFPGSKFMAERRNEKTDGYQSPQIYLREDAPDDRYRPLGRILLDRGAIANEKLDEALTIHWRRGIVLGEILRELGFVKEKDLAGALKEATAPGSRSKSRTAADRKKTEA